MTPKLQYKKIPKENLKIMVVTNFGVMGVKLVNGSSGDKQTFCTTEQFTINLHNKSTIKINLPI